jgi:IS1 family transposase
MFTPRWGEIGRVLALLLHALNAAIRGGQPDAEIPLETIFEPDRAGARKLWESLPAIYRQCATCYTDFWEAYQGVLPTKMHKAIGKDSGHTNHIERLNNTLRQRIGRLVRNTLSFSKKIENHVGAIWDFVHHHNASLQN